MFLIFFLRAVPIEGFHVDYAFLVKGLLDLYEASLNDHWLELAEQLQDVQDKLFWDSENGGYFSTTLEDQSVILRLKDGTLIFNYIYLFSNLFSKYIYIFIFKYLFSKN